MLPTSFTPFPILTTERLTLRQLVLADERDIFTLRSHSEINKYLNRQVSVSIDDARNFINKVNENITNHNAVYWGITLSDKNILVGTICLFDFSGEKCEIGYELLTNFQGRGIMKEAARKVIDYAFNTLKVKKIVACMHKDNQRSIKLLEKLLFNRSNEHEEVDSVLVCLTLMN